MQGLQLNGFSKISSKNTKVLIEIFHSGGSMGQVVRATGGGWIGFFGSTWPMATLKVDSKFLTLTVFPFGEYKFTMNEVVSFEKFWFLFSPGIRIKHNLPDYPSLIVFWHFGSSNNLIQRMLNTGFVPSADPATTPKRVLPIKLVPVLTLAGILYILMIMGIVGKGGPSDYGPAQYAIACILFLGTFMIRKSKILQQLFLKEDADVEDIKDVLNALAIISGFVLVYGLILVPLFR